MATTAETTTYTPQPAPAETGLSIFVVLDRSGSMETVRDDTIGAFNTYVEQLAKDTPEARLSLVQFDGQSIDTVFDNMAIGSVPKLTRETYVPRGSTPLFDAIGKVVAMGDAAGAERTALVILTDGEENSSREYDLAAIKALISDRQDNKHWLITYLGANQDAFAAGGAMGMSVHNTMSYDTRSMRSTFAAASASTTRYRNAATATMGVLAANYTEAERKAAGGGKVLDKDALKQNK